MEVKINLDEITAQMDELKDTKARYEFELKKVKEEIEKRELQLVALLNQMGVNEMQHGIYSFGLNILSKAIYKKYTAEIVITISISIFDDISQTPILQNLFLYSLLVSIHSLS